jgi:chromosome segregation ATPase
MPADHNRPSSSALFRDIEANLGALRQSAAASREKRSSWFGGKAESNQPDFGTSILDTLENLFAELRQTIDAQNGRLTELEREVGEINTLTDGFRELRGRVSKVEAELLEEREKSERLLVEQRDQQKDEVAKIESELREQISELSQAQGDFPKLANELRDRIQQVLDEQRVCIRQISLKTSEDAVLADRARRAVELRLDAIEQRLPGTPPK